MERCKKLKRVQENKTLTLLLWRHWKLVEDSLTFEVFNISKKKMVQKLSFNAIRVLIFRNILETDQIENI